MNPPGPMNGNQVQKPQVTFQFNVTPHPSGEAVMLMATVGNISVQVAFPLAAIEMLREKFSQARSSIPLVKLAGPAIPPIVNTTRENK